MVRSLFLPVVKLWHVFSLLLVTMLAMMTRVILGRTRLCLCWLVRRLCCWCCLVSTGWVHVNVAALPVGLALLLLRRRQRLRLLLCQLPLLTRRR